MPLDPKENFLTRLMSLLQPQFPPGTFRWTPGAMPIQSQGAPPTTAPPAAARPTPLAPTPTPQAQALMQGIKQWAPQILGGLLRFTLQQQTGPGKPVAPVIPSYPRWGIAWYDRSYGPTLLHTLSIVFNALGPMAKKK